MKKIKALCSCLFRAAADAVGHIRLLTIFVVLMMIAVVLFGISLTISNSIAKGLIRTEYQEYNEVIFNQAETTLNHNIQDLTKLCYSFMANDTIVDYLEEETFDGRVDRMDSIKAEFDRLVAIQGDIKGIYLYDLNGKMKASTGMKNFPTSDIAKTNSIAFSGLMQNDGWYYFSVTVPVFNVNTARSTRKIGYSQILVSMDFVEESLQQIMPSSDFFFLMVDSAGQIMLRKGQTPEIILNAGLERAGQITDIIGYELYQAEIPSTTWRILFGVPQKQLYASINLLQQNYYVTYAIIGLILLVQFVVLYTSVLHPIRTQIAFMNFYARNRKSRLKTTARNEMGELARNLNSMLDDIDHLTDENVKARQHMLEANYQKKQSELFAYRNQVNPHFLRNTFECIRGMALHYHVEDIASITESLSDLFSYNLLGKGYAPVADIKAHIEDYTSIIRYRFANRYSVKLNIDEDAQDVLFPKMVVQPLVENAIFHGLELVETGGEVVVTIRKSQDGARLHVTVEDNGAGMSAQELADLKEELQEFQRTGGFPARKHGVGIINIYRRLILFYDEALTFDITSVQGQGTVVAIAVPCCVDTMEEKDVPGFFD